MNLHAVVNPAIQAINSDVPGTLRVSDGYETSADGKRAPKYVDIPGVPMQVQALSGSDLRHLDALNIQGVMRAVYLNGNIEGVDRYQAKGGDLLIFNNQTWLVTQVLEPWDLNGWTKVAVTLQNDR